MAANSKTTVWPRLTSPQQCRTPQCRAGLWPHPASWTSGTPAIGSDELFAFTVRIKWKWYFCKETHRSCWKTGRPSWGWRTPTGWRMSPGSEGAAADPRPRKLVFALQQRNACDLFELGNWRSTHAQQVAYAHKYQACWGSRKSYYYLYSHATPDNKHI